MRLAAAVYETLSPFMTEMRESLAAVKTEIRDVSFLPADSASPQVFVWVQPHHVSVVQQVGHRQTQSELLVFAIIQGK